MHDALMGQYYEESPLQFLQDFISQFLKNNPRTQSRVTNTDIKKGHYDIPFGVISIDNYAFSGCTNLTVIIITASKKEDYQRILQMLPAELQKIAIATSLREKTILTLSAYKNGPGFFADMPSEITGTIIAKLAQLHRQPLATGLTNSQMMVL